MKKSKLFAVLGILVVLVGLLYAGPSILQIYMGGTGQSSFSAGVLRSSGTALSSSELSGDVTTSGSNAVTLASVVTAGSCGDTTHSCGLTYDAKGRITAATNNAISGGGGGGSVPTAVSTEPWYPPASANAMDDEFTGSTFNASAIWTAVNIGSCTLTQNNNSWLLMVCPSNGSASSMRMECQTLPAAPYEFELRAQEEIFGTTSDGFSYRGHLILRESATGKLISIGYDTNGTQLRVVSWTSSTVDASALFSSGSFTPYVPMYFKVKRSGTTLTWNWSMDDGAYFDPVYSELITAHFTTAPDQVCFGMSPYGGQWSFAIDFFRRDL